EAAAVVDPRDAPPARADGLHVDLRHQVAVLVDDGPRVHLCPVGEDRPDVEGRAADIGADDVADPEHAREVAPPQHTAGGTRVEGEDGPAAHGLDRAHAP